MAYGVYNDLPRRAAPKKVLRVKAFAIASNQKYDGCKNGLASIVLKIFDKKSTDTATYTRTGIVSKDKPLGNELHRPVTKKFSTCANYTHLFKKIFEVLIL